MSYFQNICSCSLAIYTIVSIKIDVLIDNKAVVAYGLTLLDIKILELLLKVWLPFFKSRGSTSTSEIDNTRVLKFLSNHPV
jgi:hypothetical protein